MPRTGLVELGALKAMWATAPWFAKGALVTLALTAQTIVLGLAIGLAVALLKMSSWRPARALGSLYTWAIRGTPLLAQLWLVYFGLPQFGIRLERWPAAVVALSVNAGAYLAEIIRAGIESIPRGQMEAARSLGMTYGQAMRRVILPQAYRRMLPPMVNEFVALLKDSSLVATLGVVELMMTGRLLTASTFRPFWFYGEAALFYLLLTTIFTQLGDALERRLRRHE